MRQPQAKGAVGKRAADDSRRARCRYRTCPVSRPQQLAATVRRAILGRMLGWVAFAIAGSLAAATALVLSGVVRIHRYSPAHVDGRLAVAGRGLFFSRTPDGVWWRVRVRRADGWCSRTERAGASRRQRAACASRADHSARPRERTRSLLTSPGAEAGRASARTQRCPIEQEEQHALAGAGRLSAQPHPVAPVRGVELEASSETVATGVESARLRHWRFVSMVSRRSTGAVIAGMVVAVAAAGSAQAAAPSASCAGQFFSSHAGIVPATGGEESVGGFVSATARDDGQAFGQEISGGRNLPREDCGL